MAYQECLPVPSIPRPVIFDEGGPTSTVYWGTDLPLKTIDTVPNRLKRPGQLVLVYSPYDTRGWYLVSWAPKTKEWRFGARTISATHWLPVELSMIRSVPV